MAYTRSATRSPGAGTARWMELRYAGTCSVGTDHEHPIAAGTRAFFDPRDRSTTCTDLAHAKANGLVTTEWIGSPVSGKNVEVLSERRLERFVGERPAPRARRPRRSYYSTSSRCTHEDFPCCGCDA